MTHTVTAGDTLSRIAAAHGRTVKELMALNPSITNPALIEVGQVVKVSSVPEPARTGRFTEHKRPTPNVSRGQVNKLKGVVFHHTAGSCAGSVAWLCNPVAKASAHVVIDRDGTRYVLAPPEAVCWHAGKAAWKGTTDVNGIAIGIEMVLTPEQVKAGVALTSEQIASALEYLAPLIEKHGWSLDDFTDHAHVCEPAGRKTDLSPKNWALVQIALSKIPLAP